MLDVFEVPLIDDDIIKLGLRLIINLFFMYLLVFRVYFPHQKRKSYLFTYFMLNVMVFFLCFALKKLDLGLGMALGLFAIFGIMRYRTTTLRIKEMTYLFLVVGIASINALSNKKTSYAELAFANTTIVVGSYLLERMMLGMDGVNETTKEKGAKKSGPKLLQQTVIFDELELLRPGRHEDLIRNLKDRTGMDVQRVDVEQIDLRSNSSVINVYYTES